MATTLLERLREREWRVTSQRRAVAEALEGEHVHLTVDEVHRKARVALPEISLATVYNTLNELVAMGEVAEVRHAPGPTRYDPNAGTTPHHHLLCTTCGTLFDVDPATIGTPAVTSSGIGDFRVDGVDVLFRGTCAACLSAA